MAASLPPATIHFYDVVLWIHITAVVVAFGALFAYPLFLSVNAAAPIAQRASLHRLQIAFSKRVTGPAIAVVLAAGIYLASDAHLWSRAWVGGGLGLLIVIAGLGATALRKGEQRLLALAEAQDEAGYARELRTLMRWTLLTLALLVAAIFLMAVKP
ncbi:MAG TPA: DUF2269 family protein [Solirubrobacteraceae bacterium]|jgi:hypothetical protein